MTQTEPTGRQSLLVPRADGIIGISSACGEGVRGQGDDERVEDLGGEGDEGWELGVLGGEGEGAAQDGASVGACLVGTNVLVFLRVADYK